MSVQRTMNPRRRWKVCSQREGRIIRAAYSISPPLADCPSCDAAASNTTGLLLSIQGHPPVAPLTGPILLLVHGHATRWNLMCHLTNSKSIVIYQAILSFNRSPPPIAADSRNRPLYPEPVYQARLRCPLFRDRGVNSYHAMRPAKLGR